MFIEKLMHERNLLEQTLNHHLKELYAPDNPQGILLCQKHRNGYRWRHKYLQGDRPVTVDLRKTDKVLAERLAVNLYRLVCILYLQVQILSIDNTIRCRLSGKQVEAGKQSNASQGSLLTENPMHVLLRNVQNYPRMPADFFQPASPYRLFILSHLQREYAEVIDWYLGDFIQYKEHLEYLQHPVQLGYNVRSKSEALAADRLHEEGILFHYEEAIMAGDEEYPDFLIMITVIEKYAWEHYGAMDNGKYHSRQRVKILDYLDHQWFPGINMITTYETKQHPLTKDMIDHKISWLKERYRIAFPDLPPDESFNMYDLAGYVKTCRVLK